MIDLKAIIASYPECIKIRSQFASLLHDFYPLDKRSVNIILAIYDSGIAARISGLKSIDSVSLHSFTKKLVDEFGLQEQFAVEGIEIWAKAYDVSVSYDKVPQQPVEQNNVTRNPDLYAKPGMITNGTPSDYVLEETPQGVVIAKFRGFDEADVTVPNTIDGKKIVGIGKNAYLNCKAMKTLRISEGIEFIEDGAFCGCENLSKVTFPATLSRIGSSITYDFNSKGAFANTGIIRISLPKGLQKLGEKTFESCNELISVAMPNSLTEIEDSVFSRCYSLAHIILPENLSKIGNYAFAGCSEIKNFHFPLSLREIGKSAFVGCSEFTVVVLNEGLKKIGESAFADCTKLSKILIPRTVSEIQGDLFHKYVNPTVYCYAGSYGLEFARERGYQIQNAANFSN